MAAHEQPSDAPLSDATLVAQALQGRAQAYERLVRRYERPARAICFAAVKDWHLAQDAAQEAFLIAFSKLAGLRNPAAFGDWLLTIARRRALQFARENRRQTVVRNGQNPISHSTHGTGVEDMLDLVAQLPEHERTVIMLRYVEGRNVASIARICGNPIGTITKRITRAHRHLRRLAEKEQRK